jgi:hypothetical protein
MLDLVCIHCHMPFFSHGQAAFCSEECEKAYNQGEVFFDGDTVLPGIRDCIDRTYSEYVEHDRLDREAEAAALRQLEPAPRIRVRPPSLLRVAGTVKTWVDNPERLTVWQMWLCAVGMVGIFVLSSVLADLILWAMGWGR